MITVHCSFAFTKARASCNTMFHSGVSAMKSVALTDQQTILEARGRPAPRGWHHCQQSIGHSRDRLIFSLGLSLQFSFSPWAFLCNTWVKRVPVDLGFFCSSFSHPVAVLVSLFATPSSTTTTSLHSCSGAVVVMAVVGAVGYRCQSLPIFLCHGKRFCVKVLNLHLHQKQS